MKHQITYPTQICVHRLSVNATAFYARSSAMRAVFIQLMHSDVLIQASMETFFQPTEFKGLGHQLESMC